MKADAETDEPVLIGEMDQPVAAATPAQIDEGTLNDSRTYKCNWRKLRYRRKFCQVQYRASRLM